MARNTNRTVTIKAKGIQQIVTDVKQLDKVVTDLQSEFNKLSSIIADTAAASKTDIKGLKAEIDQLNKALEKLKNSSGNVNTALSQTATAADNVKKSWAEWRKEVGENYRRMEVSEIEGLDQILDQTLDVRKRIMGAVSTASALIEQLGPYGKVAALGLKLLSPVIGDIGKSLYDSYRAANLASQGASEAAKAEAKLKEELLDLNIQLIANQKETKAAKDMKEELRRKTIELEMAQYKLSNTTAEEMANMYALSDAILDTTNSTEERMNMIYEFNEKYEAHLSLLGSELKLQQELSKAIEESTAAFVQKAVFEKYNSTITSSTQDMYAAAEQLVIVRDKLFALSNVYAQGDGDLQNTFTPNDAALYKKLKEDELRLETKILDTKTKIVEVDNARKEEVVAIAKALGNTVTFTQKGEKLTYDQERMTKKRAAHEKKIAAAAKRARKEYERQLELQHQMMLERWNRRDDEAEGDYDNNISKGNLKAAEADIQRRRKAFELKKEEWENQNKELGKLSDDAKAAEEKLNGVLDKSMKTREAITKNLMAMPKDGNTTFYASAFDQALVKQFSPEFLTQVNGKDAIKQFIIAADKNFNEAKGQYQSIYADSFIDGIFDSKYFFDELNKVGIKSPFEAIFKRSEQDLDVAYKNHRAILLKEEQKRKEGYVDIAEKQREFEEEIAKDEEKLIALRIKREAEMLEAFRSSAINLDELWSNLGNIDYETAKRAVMLKGDKALDDLLNDAKTKLEKYNQLTGETFLNFGDDFIALYDINKLFDQGLISMEELTQVKETVDAINNAMRAEVQKMNKELAELPLTYTDRLLESYKTSEALITRELDLSLKEREFVYQRYFDETARSKEASIEEHEYLNKLERKNLRDAGKSLYKEIEEMQELELQENYARYVGRLIEIATGGGDISLATRELELEMANIREKFAEMTRDVDELMKVDDPDPDKWKIKFAAEMLERVRDVGKGIADYLDTLSDVLLDKLKTTLADIDEQISGSEEKLNRLQDDLEGKISGRRDAVLSAMDLEKQRAEDLANTKIQLERKILAEQEKAAKRRKAIAIAEATINGALAIMQIWANKSAFPTPFDLIAKGVATAAMAATTALQIATISATPYAEGGYTGQGTERDSTGHKVAGVVHDGEWVAPKWMVNSPKFANTIASLESARTGRFAEGGATSPETLAGISSALNPNTNLSRQMEALTKASIALSNRPVIADVKEFSNVQSASYKRMRTNTIG